jgi:hypothetical protein
MIDIGLDDAAVLRALNQLESEMGNWEYELQESSEIIAGRIDRNFLDSRSLFQALAPSTVKGYKSREKRTGKQLIAPFDPLRGFADSLRIPATATKPGVEGSAFQIDRSSVTVGIDPEKIIYARRALLGWGTVTPERDALFITDTEIKKVEEVGVVGIRKRLGKSVGV